MLTQYAKRHAMASLVILGSLLIITSPGVAGTDGESVLIFRIGVARYRDSGEFYQGEPILVHIQIRRKGTDDAVGEKTLQIGTKELPWYENITVRVYKVKDVPASGSGSVPQSASEPANGPARSEPGGDESAPSEVTETKLLLKDVKVAKRGTQPRKYEIRANEIAWSFWVINPTITSKWPVGKYVIEAIFDTTDKQKSYPKIFHGKLRSNEVTITINEPKDNQAKAEILVSQAEYIIVQQKYDDAIKLLGQALRLNPTRKQIHCHFGRVYELKGDIKTAIREYQVYVDWVRSLNRPRTGKNDINDHADRIENTIRALEKRAGKGRERGGMAPTSLPAATDTKPAAIDTSPAADKTP